MPQGVCSIRANGGQSAPRVGSWKGLAVFAVEFVLPLGSRRRASRDSFVKGSLSRGRRLGKGLRWAEQAKMRGFHYAWLILISCCFMFAGSMALINSIIGVYMVPVTTALGCARGDFTFMLTTQAISIVISHAHLGKHFPKQEDQHQSGTYGWCTHHDCLPADLLVRFRSDGVLHCGLSWGYWHSGVFHHGNAGAHWQLVCKAASRQDDRHCILLCGAFPPFSGRRCSPLSLPNSDTKPPIWSMPFSWRFSFCHGPCSSSSAIRKTRASSHSGSKKVGKTLPRMRPKRVCRQSWRLRDPGFLDRVSWCCPDCFGEWDSATIKQALPKNSLPELIWPKVRR